MHRLSMVQALSLWGDLVAAYYGKNGFGGDTAEIYMYRLGVDDPTVKEARKLDAPSGIFQEALYDRIQSANASLYNLLEHFAKTHEATVTVNNKKLGKWLHNAGYDHRCYVRVTPRERKR